MENLEKLFQMNSTAKYVKRVELDRNKLLIEVEPVEGYFTGIQIHQIVDIVNAAHKKYGNLKYSVYIYLGEVQFIDKLTYVFLECVCYYLISRYKHPVQIYMTVKTDIATKGISSSPLLLLNDTKIDKIREYPTKFKFDIYGHHYRRVINGVGKEETNYLGELYEEIDSFLKLFSIDDECRDEVGHVIAELVGNASEHARTDCLVDIDVAPDYRRNDSLGTDSDTYYGINIAVINFSDILLGEDIYNNIIASNQQFNDRYKNVIEAYKYHKSFFSDRYTEEDFCNIAAFQTKISGRREKFETGGTGLTVLIRSLEKKSEYHHCYVISGNRCVNFYESMIEYNDEGWVGFNEEKDFIGHIPMVETTSECFIYMPGTAYNFNFIMKGKKIDG